MTPSELKYNVEKTGSVFFTRDSMKFFGDTMKNYRVRAAIKNNLFVWELWRKNPVKHGLKKSAYFDQITFERVYSREE